ncbi:MAG: hypothetical protein M3281_01715 [Chloroflexota bacterium]|nr:hypothetical protein [Chloroflexota bacterium]
MRKRERKVRFANATEEDFARLLHRLRLRWQYEPHTFVLRRKPDGTPALGFTPDFYLPDLDVYFELTTLRQKLVTAKNRKARLLAEQQPDVRLRILYRHDCQDLIRPARSRRSREVVLRKLLVAPPEETLRRAGWCLRLDRKADMSGCISVLGVRLPLGPEWCGRKLTAWIYPRSLEIEVDGETVATFPCSYDLATRTLQAVNAGQMLSTPGVEQTRLLLPELERLPSLSRRSGRRSTVTLGEQQLHLPL